MHIQTARLVCPEYLSMQFRLSSRPTLDHCSLDLVLQICELLTLLGAMPPQKIAKWHLAGSSSQKTSGLRWEPEEMVEVAWRRCMAKE